ncbi:MAG: ROK family glucokinase [Oscillospiraceae bacterium]|nr:ROK family glucokinase [Oscillospiraceae bacterium]
MRSYAIGMDIGGTTVKLGLFDQDAHLLDRWEIPTHTQDNGNYILPEAVDSIRDRLAQHGLDSNQLAGIGVGVPGPVDETGIVNKCVNLGWDVFNVKAELERLLPGIPRVAVGNDANVATLGELWQGGGRGYASAVMLTLGTGVGGGVVIGSKILPGANGAAGEVGHMTVEPEENAPCTCGKRGCLEQYASANGIVFLAKRMLTQSQLPSPLRDISSFSAKDICDLARDEDELSKLILDRCGRYLGLAMSYIACTLDPQVFLIGGGMSKAGAVLLQPIERHYRKFAFHPSAHTPIVLAELGNDAGIYGCAAMVFDQ